MLNTWNTSYFIGRDSSYYDPPEWPTHAPCNECGSIVDCDDLRTFHGIDFDYSDLCPECYEQRERIDQELMELEEV